MRENILSIRDLESKAEIVVCEIHPESTKKIAVIVFYRPPDTDWKYIKNANENTATNLNPKYKFDQLIIACGDFNLLNTD